MNTATLLAEADLAERTVHRVYFGPRAPAGKEKNGIPTKAGGRFEALFRFYEPGKPLFEKTWVLPDIEKAT